MTAAEWIDKLKNVRGWSSDYRVAKELQFKANTISMYRSHGGPMDETIALKVAGALGERPEAVLLDQYAERTKNPDVKEALRQAAIRLCILCKVDGGIKLIAYRANPACTTSICN